jgi:parallel beta-helix repeat protein
LNILKFSFFFSIGVWDTNGVPITNNVVYNTYESAIVITGTNNILQNNLVSTVYWSGQAQPEFAAFNINWDGAIQSKDATSIVMTVKFFFLLFNLFDYVI